MQKTQSLAFLIATIYVVSSVSAKSVSATETEDNRPNILFAIADDWGWPHAGAYGDPVVKTPTFDRLASEGVLFQHAYVSSPSCTPSRGAILTGQWHWRLEGAGTYREPRAPIGRQTLSELPRLPCEMSQEQTVLFLAR